MQQSLRHLLLIFGSIMVVFGLLLLLFLEINSYRSIGGLIFAAGAIIITRAIKNPHQNKNRVPSIRDRYKESRKQSSDEIH